MLLLSVLAACQCGQPGETGPEGPRGPEGPPGDDATCDECVDRVTELETIVSELVDGAYTLRVVETPGTEVFSPSGNGWCFLTDMLEGEELVRCAGPLNSGGETPEGITDFWRDADECFVAIETREVYSNGCRPVDLPYRIVIATPIAIGDR